MHIAYRVEGFAAKAWHSRGACAGNILRVLHGLVLNGMNSGGSAGPQSSRGGPAASAWRAAAGAPPRVGLHWHADWRGVKSNSGASAMALHLSEQGKRGYGAAEGGHPREGCLGSERRFQTDYTQIRLIREAKDSG